MKIIGYPPYLFYIATGKRGQWRSKLRRYQISDLDEVRKDNAQRIEPNFPQMKRMDDFHQVVSFLSRNFKQFSVEFVSIFQSGNVFYDWIIRIGVYVGDLVVQHSVNKAAWVIDEHGDLKVRFDRDIGPFEWDPFEFVERRFFFGEPDDFYLTLDIFKKLKC